MRVRMISMALAVLGVIGLAGCGGTATSVPGEETVSIDTPTGTQVAWCAGRGPAVVLVNGIGDDATSMQWVEVQKRLAERTRVCRYDRLGTGGSGPPTVAGRGAEDLDAELAATVDVAAGDAPVILVAHSFGGYLARNFADSHPDRVRAVVFVDALDPSVGVLSGTGAAAWSDVEMADEQLDLRDIEEAAQSVTHLADDPVVLVLARGQGATTAWTEGQELLAALSRRSTVRVVSDSGHQIPSEGPLAVVAAVDEVISLTE